MAFINLMRISFNHVVECGAYAHIPKEDRKKLNSKTMKCIFVGETKGYRLYDPTKEKIIFVVFKERCDPDSNPEVTESEVEYVELGLSSESEPESISISPQPLPE